VVSVARWGVVGVGGRLPGAAPPREGDGGVAEQGAANGVCHCGVCFGRCN
jgi:hypothetical protein